MGWLMTSNLPLKRPVLNTSIYDQCNRFIYSYFKYGGKTTPKYLAILGKLTQGRDLPFSSEQIQRLAIASLYITI